MDSSARSTGVRGPQFGLWSLLGLVTACGLGAGFLAANDWTMRAGVWLTAMSLLPLSLALERLFDARDRETAGAGKRSIPRGVFALSLASLGLAAVCFLPYFATSEPWHPTPLSMLVTLDLVNVLDKSFQQAGVTCADWFSTAIIVAAPAMVFLTANSFLVTQRWPGRIPQRVGWLGALLGMLSLTYSAVDCLTGQRFSNAPNSSFLWHPVAAGCWLAILALWNRRRRHATIGQATLMVFLLHAWIWTLAFPTAGGTLVSEFFRLEIKLPLPESPAPSVDREGWEQIRLGLTQEEVEALLGSRGHVTPAITVAPDTDDEAILPEYWQYEWGTVISFSDLLFSEPAPSDRAYVVWFNEEGKVIEFRPPLTSDDP